MPSSPSTYGIVVIGRNEGDRLKQCLRSLPSEAPIVYVDSGSSDGSVDFARSMGIEIIELGTESPFSAARARNAGYRRLLTLRPEIDFIQFVDGDCALVPQWPTQAISFLREQENAGAVFGRRRELYPEHSVYNRLCDWEWDGPVGDGASFGGDVMIRTSALASVGGYREYIIAGEDTELCLRMRLAHWSTWRLGNEMTLHDAAISNFPQWWRRSVRCGYAFAQNAHVHSASPERLFVWESRRARMWGIWIPMCCIAITLALGRLGLIAWMIYPLQIFRQSFRARGSIRDRVTLGVFQTLARFPESWGQIRFLRNYLTSRQARIIEYK
jgi:glycosyltransferase involved in cell wall biosynthesis